MRSQRRHEGEKRAQRVLAVWRASAVVDPQMYAPNGALFEVMRYTRVRCSGPCCGNPRKWFGERTIQERKADETMKAQMIEAGLQ